MTYVIFPATASVPASIRCLMCGRRSWSTVDVGRLYCGHCHVFHEPLRGLRDAAGPDPGHEDAAVLLEMQRRPLADYSQKEFLGVVVRGLERAIALLKRMRASERCSSWFDEIDDLVGKS